MDKLGAHIVKLLNENQQVYLPGIGTFKKERVPARFDENTNAFLAPTQKIIFNTEKGSTAPLINTISKEKGSSKEESENQLRELIGTLLLELNEKGKCHIPDLGELVKKEEAITFIEDKRDEDLPYYKNVDEIKLIEATKKEPIIVQETPLPLINEETKNGEEVEEEILSVEEFEPKGRPINWLWPILIIIVIVAAGALWFFNSEKLEQAEIATVGIEDSKSEVLPDTTLALKPEETEVGHQDTTLISSLENTEHIEEAPRKPETTYEIIIVSFGKLADAEKYVENMNAKGYKIRILENQSPGNLYKVSYSSFTDETEAQIELNNVRETIAKEAWIYKTKNN